MPWQLVAWEKKSTVKLFNHVFYALTDKKVIKVYTRDTFFANTLNNSKKISVVNKEADADIVLITSKKDMESLDRYSLPQEVLIFTTSYKLLKTYPKTIGAFYWRKGRSQLLFVRERLEMKNITLPREYQKFIVEAL